MNESYAVNESTTSFSAQTGVENIDAFAPELLALREARKRAFEARVAAEDALRQAEEAEAGLLAKEAEAVAAATAARREQAAEIAKIAAARERDAIERVGRLEAQLQQSAQAKEHAQLAAAAVAKSREEALRALDRLDASLAGFQEQLQSAESNELQLLAELALVREHAQEASRAREQAEASISAAHGTVMPRVGPLSIVVAEAPNLHPVPAPVSDLQSIAAQRAAERRAADAARARQLS